MNHEHSQKDKIVRLNGGGAQRLPRGIPRVGLQYKYNRVRENRGFFPGETCEPLVVRGTTSFYNNKLQILLVGEGAMWNV